MNRTRLLYGPADAILSPAMRAPSQLMRAPSKLLSFRQASAASKEEPVVLLEPRKSRFLALLGMTKCGKALAVGATLMFALAAAAGQSPSARQQPSSAAAVHDPHAMPTAESHLKVLAEKLELTSEQQAKARPIVQEMHDATLKIAQDDSLSHEERTNRFRPIYEKADKQLREILNDEQKKKLDQFEQEHHPDMHSNAN